MNAPSSPLELATADRPSCPLEHPPYEGRVAAAFATEPFRAWLRTVLDTLATAGTSHRCGARHDLRIVRTAGLDPDEDIAIKVFGPQARWKDRLDRARGSKAQRSFDAGRFLTERGVGTPLPIACIDRWEGSRLVASYHLTRYEPRITCFRDALIQIYRHEPDCQVLMALLHSVARAVRAMHDHGFQHRDLGNQNIMLRRLDTDTWGDIRFIDLNRARIKPQLSLRERAFDLSRISLPSDFLRVFKAMYFGDDPTPKSLDRWERRYRARFAFHTLTRPLRHPLRARRQPAETDPATTYPADQDLWIWDERSAQAMVTLRSKDRHRHYPAGNAARIAAASLRALPAVFLRYRELRQTVYQQPVALAQRVGMAVHTAPESWAREREWLARLGRLPVLIRFCHHQGEAVWRHTADCVRTLHADGYPVAIALVQDRRAVREPDRWDAFVCGVLDEVGGLVDWVEAGHAINRVKWGVWSQSEYLRLLQPLADYATAGRCRFMGPAVIDFEYHHLIAALDRIGRDFRFDALSHHLYVDRRGAPENAQGGFSTVEKCVLARAIADHFPACASRLIISEVNWPLAGTGAWSPVGAPYITPGPRSSDPSVSEELYADYLLRYLVLTLASGMVERVYWWRLVAHGFGLVDDIEPGAWRARPAFERLKVFLELLGTSTFTGRIAGPAGAAQFGFEREDGEHLVLAYAHPGEIAFEPSFAYAAVRDGHDRPLAAGGPLRLTGSPVYFRQVQTDAPPSA